MTKPIFNRVLLKVSGEALMGDQGFGIDVNVADRIASDIAQVRSMGVEIGIVVGGVGFHARHLAPHSSSVQSSLPFKKWSTRTL